MKRKKYVIIAWPSSTKEKGVEIHTSALVLTHWVTEKIVCGISARSAI